VRFVRRVTNVQASRLIGIIHKQRVGQCPVSGSTIQPKFFEGWRGRLTAFAGRGRE
jgi:hypothetical protein